MSAGHRRAALLSSVLILWLLGYTWAHSEAPVLVPLAPAAVHIPATVRQAAAEHLNDTRCPANGSAPCPAQASAASGLADSNAAAAPPSASSEQHPRQLQSPSRGRSSSSSSSSSTMPRGGKPKAQVIAELREENDWKNKLILFWLPDGWLESAPRAVRAWARCYLACMALYMVVGGAWAYYIYAAFGFHLFPGGQMPAGRDMLEQIKVACMSIPVYAMLPAAEEWVMERGWTRAYTRVSDVGLGWHLAYFAAFMASVEFGVYWMHRLLHDVKSGYKHLHHIHHKYNKENTLSPFAGLAFHPLDGILQALPYCWTLFFIPAHAITFELLLFLTGIWTTNIHDCIDGKVEPIMGAGYHTIHHTTYRHNYGHYFIYMDEIFGSLVSPAEFEAAAAKGKVFAAKVN